MKKSDIFSHGKNSIKKMDPASKETLKSGKTLKKNITNAAGRQGMLSVAMMMMCGLGMAEVGGGLIAMEFNKPAKNNVQEDHPLLMPFMYFVGCLICLGGINELLEKKLNKELALKKLMWATNLHIDENQCALAFGLMTNYMTDAEYKKIQDIIKEWQTTKVKSGYEVDVVFDYTNKISKVLNGVLDRTVGLRETLRRIANGKDGPNIALFQQEANKIYANKQNIDR